MATFVGRKCNFGHSLIAERIPAGTKCYTVDWNSELVKKPVRSRYQSTTILRYRVFLTYWVTSIAVSSEFMRVCLICWNSSLLISPRAYRFSTISNAVSEVRPSVQYVHGGLKPSCVKNSRKTIAMTIIIAIHIMGNIRIQRIREGSVAMFIISRSGHFISRFAPGGVLWRWRFPTVLLKSILSETPPNRRSDKARGCSSPNNEYSLNCDVA